MRSLAFLDRVPGDSEAFQSKVIDVARDLTLYQKFPFNPNWLMGIMENETSGTFSPSIINPLGYVGLIQFGTQAAAVLNTTTYDLGKMDAVTQLDYVERYFKNVIDNYGALKTYKEAYLAVFYPAALKGGKTYKFPTWVTSANPEFNVNKVDQMSVNDFETAIWSRIPATMKGDFVGASYLLIAAAVGVVVWLLT